MRHMVSRFVCSMITIHIFERVPRKVTMNKFEIFVLISLSILLLGFCIRRNYVRKIFRIGAALMAFVRLLRAADETYRAIENII